MSDPATDAQARNRWLAMTGARIVGSIGAVFGVVLLAKAQDWPVKMLAIALVLAALWFTATVPAALAHRWRTPDK